MTTVVKNPYANRISLGELNVGSGSMNRYAQIGGFPTTYTLTPPYYDVYYLTGHSISSTYTLPPIGYGPNDVMPGWKVTFAVYFGVSTPPLPPLIIKDNLGNTITQVAQGIYDTTLSSGNVYYTLSFNAVDTTPTWNYTTCIPQSTSFVSSKQYSQNYYANGIPAAKAVAMFGKGALPLLNTSANNVNVLFATPVLLTWSTTALTNDPMYMTITGTPNVNILVSGVYYFQCSLLPTNSGGATSTNIQVAVRKNGVAIPSAVTATSTTTGNPLRYTLQGFIPLVAGDIITIVAGKSVISLGSTILSGTVFIKYIG